MLVIDRRLDPHRVECLAPVLAINSSAGAKSGSVATEFALGWYFSARNPSTCSALNNTNFFEQPVSLFLVVARDRVFWDLFCDRQINNDATAPMPWLHVSRSPPDNTTKVFPLIESCPPRRLESVLLGVHFKEDRIDSRVGLFAHDVAMTTCAARGPCSPPREQVPLQSGNDTPCYLFSERLLRRHGGDRVSDVTSESSRIFRTAVRVVLVFQNMTGDPGPEGEVTQKYFLPQRWY